MICHFYDVESGRMELDKRGQGTNYERFDIPIARDGGIADLLAETKRPDRRFDVVICESMSRLARKMFETLSVERELEQAEVPVFASNEPILLSGGRAQQILQRRINQSVAEYEVLNMLEQSWGGTCTHVREGYNIGKPPYGYAAKKFRHPNPAKAEKGLTKTRLEPDGIKGEAVALMAKWRYHEGVGCDTISERLNMDLDKYPPPEPPGGQRARGAWSKSSVVEILKNPKYTGYQVYNRRARRSRGGRNKPNPPEMWVWSTEPAHEPLIPKWMFGEINAASARKKGSRDGAELNVHPTTTQAYLLRGRVKCACDRRMLGHRHRGFVYYRCWPTNNNRGRPDKHAGHPRTVYIREEAIVDAVNQVFSEFLFAPGRRELLLADVGDAGNQAERERQEKRARLERRIADHVRKQENLMRQAEDADPNDPFVKGLRDRYNEIEAARCQLLDEVEHLDQAEAAVPRPANHADGELIESLPHLVMNLHRAPHELQHRLFELTQLTIHVHYETGEVTVVITLPRDEIQTVASAAASLSEAATQPASNQEAAKPQVEPGVNAVRAPGATRTHTGRILSPLPLPIGLRGLAGGNFTRSGSSPSGVGVCRITLLVTASSLLPRYAAVSGFRHPYSEEDPGDRSGYRGPCAASRSCRRG
nr:Recombinase [Kibdelosporangium sp. MJ126-NF4]